MVAERNMWPKGVNNESCYRMSERAVWFDGQEWKQVGLNQALSDKTSLSEAGRFCSLAG